MSLESKFKSRLRELGIDDTDFAWILNDPIFRPNSRVLVSFRKPYPNIDSSIVPNYPWQRLLNDLENLKNQRKWSI